MRGPRPPGVSTALYIKITDTLPSFIYASASRVTSYSEQLVHLLKEHGNSRSEISNVSISGTNQTKSNHISTLHGLNSNVSCNA